MNSEGSNSDERATFEQHRSRRLSASQALFLSPDFAGPTPDPHLSPKSPKLDTRYGISLVARPPLSLLPLFASVLEEWPKQPSPPTSGSLPPPSSISPLLEVTHCQPEYPSSIVSTLSPSLGALISTVKSSGVTLDSPQVSFDAGGIAVTFLPTRGSSSYLCLRSSLSFSTATAPRYLHPSAHITIARFSTHMVNRNSMLEMVDVIDGVNKSLENDRSRDNWKWTVGTEEGGDVECRSGLVWYGGGDTILPTTV